MNIDKLIIFQKIYDFLLWLDTRSIQKSWTCKNRYKYDIILSKGKMKTPSNGAGIGIIPQMPESLHSI